MDLKKIDEVYNSPHCCVNPFPIGEDVDSKLEPQRITKPSSLDAKSSKGHFENTKNVRGLSLDQHISQLVFSWFLEHH